MSLVQVILKDVAYSSIATGVINGVGIDDTIAGLLPSSNGQKIVARSLTVGTINYVTNEVLDYVTRGKIPDVITMNFMAVLDSLSYFSLAALGISALKIDNTVGDLYDKYLPIPASLRDPLLDGSLLSAARVSRSILDSYGGQYRNLAHPILLLPSGLMPGSGGGTASSSSNTYAF